MNDLMLLLLAVYALAGVGVALVLIRGGTTPWTAAAAVFAWPLLLPAARQAPEPTQGPLRQAIEEAFLRLPSECRASLAPLRASLLRADERLALADRILAEPVGEGLQDSAARLRSRRQATASQIEAVLDEIARLRLQLGLAALDGEALPLREALQQLLLRARALDEVERIGDGEGSPSVG